MNTGEALKIIYDLALENALDPVYCEGYEIHECDRQNRALNLAYDYIIKTFGE